MPDTHALPLKLRSEDLLFILLILCLYFLVNDQVYYENITIYNSIVLLCVSFYLHIIFSLVCEIMCTIIASSPPPPPPPTPGWCARWMNCHLYDANKHTGVCGNVATFMFQRNEILGNAESLHQEASFPYLAYQVAYNNLVASSTIV